MAVVGQQLHVVTLLRDQRSNACIRVASDEVVDLISILLAKNRTCREQQFTTRLEHSPQGIEQMRALACKRFDVLLAPQPFDVGMTADDA